MPRQSQKQMMKIIYAAFAAGDLNPLFRAVSADVVLNNHGAPASPLFGIYGGISALQAYFEKIAAVDIQKFEAICFTECANRVIVLLDVRQVVRDSGQTNEGLFVHVWSFNNDRITRADFYEAGAVPA